MWDTHTHTQTRMMIYLLYVSKGKRVCVRACMCVRACVHVYVCVFERERKIEKGKGRVRKETRFMAEITQIGKHLK